MTSVAFFGNVANNMLTLVRSIRERSNLDAHLFIDERDSLATLPSSEDPSLAGGYPDWIHGSDYVTPRTMLAPWRSELTRELAKYDLVVASGTGPIYAQFTGRPWFFYVTGGDLTMLPFGLRYLDQSSGIRRKAGFLVTSAWQRRAIPRASDIWVPPYPAYLGALRRLGVPEAKRAKTYFPMVLDVDRFSPRLRPDSGQAADLRAAHDFVVFHPSRLMIDDRPKQRAIGNWKNNDALIRGFADFVRRGAASNPVLAMPDRTASPDVALAKSLIDELGVNRFVKWLIPSSPEGFTRHELIDFYAASDVVCDGFGIGWFGSVTFEGLSMAKPVLGYVDEEATARIYPSHPIISVRAPSEIADALERLAQDPASAKQLGKSGRSWLEEHHGPAPATDVYIRYLSAADGSTDYERR